MQTFEGLADWRATRAGLNGSIGLVPTMGALHAGHEALINASTQGNALTVLSIYVNPTQFNNAEDLDNYPNTLAQDLAIAERLGVDHVLLPKYDEIYADGFRFSVDENEFSRTLCGAHRPGHFTGVLTVVMKLLNIVQPTRAYFGEKDHQQLTLIRDMVDAFFMSPEVIGVPTVREADGLAMSSRNLRLTAQARALAPTFAKLLASTDSDDSVRAALEAAGFVVDYLESHSDRRYGAVNVNCGDYDVRLIDNVAKSSR